MIQRQIAKHASYRYSGRKSWLCDIEIQYYHKLLLEIYDLILLLSGLLYVINLIFLQLHFQASSSMILRRCYIPTYLKYKNFST